MGTTIQTKKAGHSACLFYFVKCDGTILVGVRLFRWATHLLELFLVELTIFVGVIDLEHAFGILPIAIIDR